jgi:hypothetical protein
MMCIGKDQGTERRQERNDAYRKGPRNVKEAGKE